MWRDRIIETRKAKGITIKMMAERTPSQLTVETITRILNERTDDPRISTVLALGAAVGLSPWELFAETADLIAYQSFLNLQAEVDALKVDKEALAAENEALKNNVNEVVALKADNDRLSLTLSHKEEIISMQGDIIRLFKAFSPLP